MNMNARASRKQFGITIVIILCLLCTPLTALARRGERNYRRGLQHEAAQRWDQAVQEFALAVAANPSDTEYLLHYRRAVFNASQMFMQQGRALAERGDYPGAYNAFRQSHAYDPNNELALSEMQRMLRLHREATGTTGATMTPASLQTGANGQATPPRRPQTEELPPARTEQVTDINYNNVELDFVVRSLAERLGLNVIFDRDLQAQATSQRRVTLNLRNVTTAEALDYVFTSQNLFFQRLSRRTILVADQSKRPQYQQLVLRTFFLQNADPARVRELILGVVPPTAGRPVAVMPNVQTNSITVRDTPENIRLIGELIDSIDKDRAAVVMEVAIYEVSRTDLQQLGLQIGTIGTDNTASSLLSIAGSTAIGIGGLANTVAGVPNAIGLGLIIPQTSLSAFQRNDRTRLIYRNQVHAFDGEETLLRSGQRVPFQSGVIPNYTITTGNQTTTPNQTPTNNQFLSNGYPIISQEPTGLTLNFTPTVFPNLDVQVKMKIQSREVFNPGTTLTPTFTEREITGSARIQNNQTLMLASVAQDRQSNGRVGLPLLGLIPIIGRIFSTPRRDNFNTDIVITVTPRVLRAPDITPSDEQMRPVGTQQTPVNDSLALLMRQIDREEQLAAATTTTAPATAPTVTASVNPTSASATTTAAATTTINNPPPPAPATINATVTNSTGASMTNTGASVTAPPALDTGSPSFVPAPRALMESAPRRDDGADEGASVGNTILPIVPTPTSMINASAPTSVPRSGTTSGTTNNSSPPNSSVMTLPPVTSPAELRLIPENQTLRVGERRRLMIVLKTDAPLNMAIANLRFDPRMVAIRSVTTGNMFQANGQGAMPTVSHSADANGTLLVSVAPPAGGPPIAGAGVFLIIELEGLATGSSQVQFVPEGVHLMAADGRPVRVVLAQSQVTVTQ